MTLILGLMGAAGSGKSTVAQYLAERYGAKRYSFADPLKELVMRSFDLSREQCYGTQAQKEAVDPRYNVSPRWLLQRIGTEGARATFGDNFWTDALLRKISADGPAFAVVEDARFVNEAVAIRAFKSRHGGMIWRLECPDRQSAADAGHASESEWKRSPFDAIVTAPMSPGSHLLKVAVEKALGSSSRIMQVIGSHDREVL